MSDKNGKEWIDQYIKAAGTGTCGHEENKRDVFKCLFTFHMAFSREEIPDASSYGSTCLIEQTHDPIYEHGILLIWTNKVCTD